MRLQRPVFAGKAFFSSAGDIIAKYAAAPDTTRVPTHARPVHSAITESGHLSVDQRTFSASAKRSYVFGVARTSHLTALAFPTFRSHAHFGPFTDGDGGVRVRAERASLKTVCRRPAAVDATTPKFQDEASERRPRARVHQRYAVFAPCLGCVSRLGSNIQFFPDTGARPKRGVRDVCERHASPAVIRMHRQHPRRID